MKLSNRHLKQFSGGVAGALIVSAASAISSSIVLLICAMFLLAFAVRHYRLLLRNIISPLYLSLVAVLFVATLNTVLIADLEFSLWQVARAQVWTVIGFPLAVAAKSAALKLNSRDLSRWTNMLYGFSFASLVLAMLDVSANTSFSPAYIRSDTRVYTVAALMVPGVLIYAIAARRRGLALSLLGLAILTMGKTYFGLSVFALLVSLMYFINFNRMTIRREGFWVSTIMLISIIVFSVSQYDRLASALEVGDVSRERQSSQVMEALHEVRYGNLIGLGVGTKIIEGNYISTGRVESIDASTGLFANSQYDIEAGYFHLLARFGFIGCALLCMYMARGFRSANLLFFGYSAIFLVGASWAGVSHVFSLVAFGWGVGALQALKRSEENDKRVVSTV